MKLPTKSVIFFLIVSVLSAQAGHAAVKCKKYETEGSYFKYCVPDNWKLKKYKTDQAQEIEKIYGLELTGPENYQMPVAVFLDFYSSENTFCKSEDDFVIRNSTGLLPGKDERYSVKKGKFQNRSMRTIERRSFTYKNPESPAAEKILIKEKLAVISAKTGFYVLHYTAPVSAYKKYLKDFEKIFKSFTPLK